MQKCDYDVQKAQRGIVYIDETTRFLVSQTTRLLPVTFPVKRTAGTVETDRRYGSCCSTASGRKHPQQEFLQVDTSKILFIVAVRLPVWIK